MGYLENLLASGERVVHRTRRHVIVLTRTVGGALVVVAVGLGLAAFFGFFSDGGALWAVWGGLALAAIGLVAAFPAWLRWRSEQYVVTDRRVIQVEGIFQKQVLDSSLNMVNDVLLKQSLFGRLLGYGTIEILTASEHGINRLETLPDPLGFKRAMLEARGAPAVSPAVAGMPLAASTSTDAAGRLAQLDEMKRRGLVSADEYQAKRRQILEGL
jgi:uncharacterized membrane protein YdbT with pleckstrin-like domain